MVHKQRLRVKTEIRPGVFAFTFNSHLMHSLPPAEYRKLLEEQFTEDLHATTTDVEREDALNATRARHRPLREGLLAFLGVR